MIIGLTGKKQSGKTTAADYLNENFDFAMRSFADPLKGMAFILLDECGLGSNDIHDKEAPLPKLGVSYRKLLQSLGTEWGRNLVPDLWVICAENDLKHYTPSTSLVYDDVRFENEADFIRAKGGLVVHIERPGLVSNDPHESESGIKFKPGDERLVNNDMDDFLHQFRCLVESKLPMKIKTNTPEGA